MKNSELSAFPTQATGYIGLTKLEYFAGLAMQGILASCTGVDFVDAKTVAKHAVVYAKALVAEFEK